MLVPGADRARASVPAASPAGSDAVDEASFATPTGASAPTVVC